MNEREALRLALEALEDVQEAYGNTSEWFKERVEAVRKALEQPEPEPVAWIDHRIHGIPDCFVMQPDPPHTSPVYTSPSKREWQGLTEDEISKLVYSCDYDEYEELVRATEAKLKERNT